MVVSSELYPFQGNYLDLAGNRLHYLDEGSGEPLVMVHGNPTWSFYYRNLVKAFSDRYRVIAPDHIGCGMSDKPGRDSYPYTLKQRVADLEALLEKLEIGDNITLVVHDWGGMIGMTYATLHPEKIKRLVILNTGAFHLPKTKPFPRSIWFCRTPLLGPLLVQGGNAFCLAAARWCATKKPLTPEIRHGYLAPYDSWANRIAVLRFVQDIPLVPSDEGYQLVSQVEDNIQQFRSIPTVICWGEKDFVFDEHFLKQWTEYLPEAKVHRFPEAGHYVLEDASDEIIAIVDEFLNAHPIHE
jgi:cis-3-alkyl-4-acyloxetan-2-one decarboxylase